MTFCRPSRRTYLKILHWGIIPFFVWFLFADPDALRRMGKWYFRFHSVMGLIFVVLSLIWTADYLWRGLASRPGPKLQGWARRFHHYVHRIIIWGLFLVALGGFLLGLTSTVTLWAGGIIPIAPPQGLPKANDVVGHAHTYQFYALAALIMAHASFHIWRHVVLRDNALRIMAPKMLHKWL